MAVGGVLGSVTRKLIAITKARVAKAFVMRSSMHQPITRLE